MAHTFVRQQKWLFGVRIS